MNVLTYPEMEQAVVSMSLEVQTGLFWRLHRVLVFDPRHIVLGVTARRGFLALAHFAKSDRLRQQAQSAYSRVKAAHGTS